MDPRRYRAFTARSACAAGHFNLMGRKLRALSACHYTLLEALESPLITVGAGACELLDLAIIADLCSVRRPEGTIPEYLGSELARRALTGLRDASAEPPDPALLANFSFSPARLAQFQEQRHAARIADALHEQRLILSAWLNLCVLSWPAERGEASGAGVKQVETNVPSMLYRVAVVLRELPGFTHDELWYDLSVAELHWWYEAAREQRDGMSWIAENGEEPPAAAPEDAALPPDIARAMFELQDEAARRKADLEHLHADNPDALVAGLAELDAWFVMNLGTIGAKG